MMSFLIFGGFNFYRDLFWFLRSSLWDVDEVMINKLIEVISELDLLSSNDFMTDIFHLFIFSYSIMTRFS